MQQNYINIRVRSYLSADCLSDPLRRSLEDDTPKKGMFKKRSKSNSREMKHAGNKWLLKNVESPQVMKLQSLTILSTINFLIFQNRRYRFCAFL